MVDSVIFEIINSMVGKAKESLSEYLEFNQDKIDRIVKFMYETALENISLFSKMAINETKRGVFEDKVVKNEFASRNIWEYIKDIKTVGVIKENFEKGYKEIAAPLGIIAGVTPVTNPTSTVIFKSLISVKTRNPIIFAFHPQAQNCSSYVANVLREAAIEAGAPKYCIQWVENPSIKATLELMNHSGVSTVLATGGPSMVKSAYSTGKPALGVGPGNVPCYVEKSADLKKAVDDIIVSKTFDNGMICASEQSIVVDEIVSTEFENLMKNNGCYFLNNEEKIKLENFMIDPEKKTLRGIVAGKSAYEIAKNSGINVSENVKILVVKLSKAGIDSPLSMEKLSPVLSYYMANGSNEAFKLCEEILKFGGEGHTAAIHSKNEDIIDKFSEVMNAGRIIVNSPSSQGAIGGLCNCGVPSLTLGCGSWGKNSTTDNISVNNLINIKRAYRSQHIGFVK